MIKLLLVTSLLNEIFSVIFNMKFSESQLPYIYMKSNNDIILYNPYNTKGYLYYFFLQNNSFLYNNRTIYQLLDQKNLINEINNGYFKSYQTKDSIDFFYFNESYYYISSLNKQSLMLSFTSLESIGQNNFIYFINSLLINYIYFVEFKFNSTSKEYDMIIKKRFILNDITMRTNCYCVLTNNNNTVCGLIKILNEISYSKIYYSYNMILFNDTTYSEILIYKGNQSMSYTYQNDFGELYKYIKLIPLEDEKILYCFKEEGLLCGLIQIKGLKMITLIKNQIIFDYGSSKKNEFSGIKYKDNQILLALQGTGVVYISKITILSNNTFQKRI